MNAKAARSGSSDVALAGPAPDHGGAPLANFQLGRLRCRIVAGESPDAAAHAIGRLQIDGCCYQIVPEPASPTHTDDDPTRLLTAREFQIVRLVCFGQLNKQIADRLRISEYTVRTYLKQIFIKLDVHSRAALAFRCARWVGGSP